MKAYELIKAVMENSKAARKVPGELADPNYDNMGTPDNHTTGKYKREVDGKRGLGGHKHQMPKTGVKEGMKFSKEPVADEISKLSYDRKEPAKSGKVGSYDDRKANKGDPGKPKNTKISSVKQFDASYDKVIEMASDLGNLLDTDFNFNIDGTTVTESEKAPKDMREIAYDWHGGMSSPLYSFASTGKVHGKQHKNCLLEEIMECYDDAKMRKDDPEFRNEPDRLIALYNYVKNIEVGQEEPMDEAGNPAAKDYMKEYVEIAVEEFAPESGNPTSGKFVQEVAATVQRKLKKDGMGSINESVIRQKVITVLKRKGYLNEEKKGLYHNVNKRKQQGKSPRKPGDENYPSDEAWEKSRKTAKEDWNGDTMPRKKTLKRVRKQANSRLPDNFNEDDGEDMEGEDPCWDGYKMVGHKTKDGKKVPNCVPKEGLGENDKETKIVLNRRRNEHGEFVVKYYENGKFNDEKSYYTEDWEDAVATMKDMKKRAGISESKTMGSLRAGVKKAMGNLKHGEGEEYTKNFRDHGQKLMRKGADRKNAHAMTKKAFGESVQVGDLLEWKSDSGVKYCGEIVEMIGSRAVVDMNGVKVVRKITNADFLGEDDSPSLKKKHKSDKGGLAKKGRDYYNRKTGSNLKRPQPEGGKRKDSYCARSKGQQEDHNIMEYGRWPDSERDSTEDMAKEMSNFEKYQPDAEPSHVFQNGLELYVQNGNNKFYLNAFYEDRPVVSFFVIPNPEDELKGVLPWSIWAVYASPNFRGLGYVYQVYDWLLQNVGALRNGGGLTAGSIKVWKALAKKYPLYVFNPWNSEDGIKRISSEEMEQYEDSGYDVLLVASGVEPTYGE